MINVLLLISSVAFAQSGEELYQTRGCASCHEMQVAGCPDLTLLKEDGTETRPFLSMRLMYVDRNNAIFKKKLVIKIINKITSFGLNWDYLG